MKVTETAPVCIDSPSQRERFLRSSLKAGLDLAPWRWNHLVDFSLKCQTCTLGMRCSALHWCDFINNIIQHFILHWSSIIYSAEEMIICDLSDVRNLMNVVDWPFARTVELIIDWRSTCLTVNMSEIFCKFPQWTLSQVSLMTHCVTVIKASWTWSPAVQKGNGNSKVAFADFSAKNFLKK